MWCYSLSYATDAQISSTTWCSGRIHRLTTLTCIFTPSIGPCSYTHTGIFENFIGLHNVKHGTWGAEWELLGVESGHNWLFNIFIMVCVSMPNQAILVWKRSISGVSFCPLDCHWWIVREVTCSVTWLCMQRAKNFYTTGDVDILIHHLRHTKCCNTNTNEARTGTFKVPSKHSLTLITITDATKYHPQTTKQQYLKVINRKNLAASNHQLYSIFDFKSPTFAFYGSRSEGSIGFLTSQ